MQRQYAEFFHNGASCTVVHEGEHGKLIRVYSKIRGQGHATALLTKVCEWADENGVYLNLIAMGYGGPVQTMLDPRQLRSFYEKFGFVALDAYPVGPRMARTPRRKNTSYDEREN